MSKIKEEELIKLNSLVKEKEQLLVSIGNIETKKHILLHDIVDVDRRLSVFSSELKSVYGDNDINLKTGEIYE